MKQTTFPPVPIDPQLLLLLPELLFHWQKIKSSASMNPFSDRRLLLLLRRSHKFSSLSLSLLKVFPFQDSAERELLAAPPTFGRESSARATINKDIINLNFSQPAQLVFPLPRYARLPPEGARLMEFLIDE